MSRQGRGGFPGRRAVFAVLVVVACGLSWGRGADGGGAGTGFEGGTPEVVRVGPSTFELRVQLYEAGDVYYVLQAPSFPAPTTEDIVAGGAEGYLPTLAGAISSLGAHEERFVNVSGSVGTGGNFSLFLTSQDGNSTWEDSVAVHIRYTECPVCSSGMFAHVTRFSCDCVALSSLSSTEFIPGVQQYFAGPPEVHIATNFFPGPLGRTVPMKDFPGALSPQGYAILQNSPLPERSFNFTARYGGYHCHTCSFTCQLDLGDVRNCTSPHTYEHLEDGEHIFTVTSTGMDGFSTAKKDFVWTVEAPIRTAYVRRPRAISGDDTPEFTVASNKDGHTRCVQPFPLFCPERNVTHEYRLNPSSDEAAFTPVGKNFTITGIQQGLNTIQARSIVDGYVEKNPPVYTWWYDVDEPTTAIDGGLEDSSIIFAKSVSYEFWGADDDTGVDFFECRLTSSGTGGAPTLIDDWDQCKSPHTVYGIDGYPYTTSGIQTVFTFSVRAVDRAGNRDSSPASRSFQVDITLPKEATVTVRVGDFYRNAENNTASVEEDTMSPLGAVVILPEDDTTQYFRFTEIVGGNLYKASGTCLNCLKCTTCPEEILNGSFVTTTAANAGTRFMPKPNTYTGDTLTSNFSFTVQPSLNSSDSGLGGKPITVRFNVSQVNDQPNLEPKLAFCMEAITAVDSKAFNTGTSVREILDHHPDSIDDRFDGPLLKYGIAIVGSDISRGSWEYTTDMGERWSPLDRAATKSSTLLEADAGLRNRIRFVPLPGMLLERDDGFWTSLTFAAWDMSDGRVSGASYDATYSSGSVSQYSFYGSSFYGTDIDYDEGEEENEAEDEVPDVCAPGFCIPVENLDHLSPFSNDVAAITLEVVGLPGVSLYRSTTETTRVEKVDSAQATMCTGQAAAVQLSPFNCNSTTQYVDIEHPDFRVVEKPPPWTVEMWVKKSVHLAVNALLTSSTSRAELLLEQYPGTGRVGVTLQNGTALDFNYSAPSDTWTHLAFACEEDSLELYASGIAVGTLNVSFPMPLSSIGSPKTQSALVVDEFRAWTRKKTQRDIANEMNQSLKGTEKDLYAYLKFDERCSSHPTSPDLAQGQHPARLVGGAELVDPWIGSCATVEHVNPSFGPSRGNFNLSVSGTGFSANSGASVCEFISQSATQNTPAVVHSSTSLSCEAPPGFGSAHVTFFDKDLGCRSPLNSADEQFLTYYDLEVQRPHSLRGSSSGGTLVNFVGTFPPMQSLDCKFYLPFTGGQFGRARAYEVSPGSFSCEMPPAQGPTLLIDVQVGPSGLDLAGYDSQARFQIEYFDADAVEFKTDSQHNASVLTFSREGGQVITLSEPGYAEPGSYLCGLGTIRPLSSRAKRGTILEFVLPASAGEKNVTVSTDGQLWFQPRHAKTIAFAELPYVEDELVIHVSGQEVTAAIAVAESSPLPFFCDMAGLSRTVYRFGATLGCGWLRSRPGFSTLRYSFENAVFQDVRTVLQIKPAALKRSGLFHFPHLGSTLVSLDGTDFNKFDLQCIFNGTSSAAMFVSSSHIKCEHVGKGGTTTNPGSLLLQSLPSHGGGASLASDHGANVQFLRVGETMMSGGEEGARGRPEGGSEIFIEWTGEGFSGAAVPLAVSFGATQIVGGSSLHGFLAPAGVPGRTVPLRVSTEFAGPNLLNEPSLFTYRNTSEGLWPSTEWGYSSGSSSVTFEGTPDFGVDSCIFGTISVAAFTLPHRKVACHTPRTSEGFSTLSLSTGGDIFLLDALFSFVAAPRQRKAVAPLDHAAIVLNGTVYPLKEYSQSMPVQVEGSNFGTQHHLQREVCSVVEDGMVQVRFVSSALIVCHAGDA